MDIFEIVSAVIKYPKTRHQKFITPERNEAVKGKTKYLLN